MNETNSLRKAYKMNKILFLFLMVLIFTACNQKRIDEDMLSSSSAAPRLSGISKTSGVTGDTIVVNGQGFTGGSSVNFGNNGARVISRTDNQLTVVSPPGTGSVFVRVYNGIYSSNELAFTYITSSRLAGTNLINLQGRIFSIDTTAMYPVGPGTTYMQLTFNDTISTATPLNVYFLVYDVTHPYLTFKPVLANDNIMTKETVPSMAVRKSSGAAVYFAGTNADMPATGYPAHWNTIGPNQGLIIDRQIISSPTPLKTSAVANTYLDGHIFFENSKKPFIDYALFSGWAKSGALYFPLDGVNRYRDAYQTNLITRSMPHTNQNNGGVDAYIDFLADNSYGPNSLGQDINTKITRLATQVANSVLPANGMILTGHVFNYTILTSLRVNDNLTVNVDVRPQRNYNRQFDQMIGGRHTILREGIISDTNWVGNMARTAMGVSQDGNTALMCVVDAPGSDTKMLAQIMQLYGAYWALNLGGGNESTVYVKGAGHATTGLMNRPNGSTTPTNVVEGIFGVSTAPADATVSGFAPTRSVMRVPLGQSVDLAFYGLNQYGLVVNSALNGVALSGAANTGTLSAYTFTATTKGIGEITAAYGGKSSIIKVIVE